MSDSPKSLFFIDENISNLKKLSPSKLLSLNSLGIFTISDLLCDRPVKYINKSCFTDFNNIDDFYNKNFTVSAVVEIIKKEKFGQGLKHLKIICKDINSNKIINLLCFNRNFYANSLFSGVYYYIFGTGKLNTYSSSIDVANFKIVQVGTTSLGLNEEKLKTHMKIEAVYSLKGSLKSSDISQLIKIALEKIDNFTDTVPQKLINHFDLFDDIKTSLYALHFPTTLYEAEKGRRTLSALEIKYILNTIHQSKTKKREIIVNDISADQKQKFYPTLPFELTDSQKKAYEEIVFSFCQKNGAKHLLQGDVGSGKTAVAFLVSSFVASIGGQVALLAPTEILARQHYLNAQKFFSGTLINPTLLIAALKSQERKDVLNKINSGDSCLIIGTQSLLSDKVDYKSLKLVIVDEQHRFGVEQREALNNRFRDVFELDMSATPIPRTLARAIMGNENVSEINQMPIGRRPVKTYLTPPNKRNAMFEFIIKKLNEGGQVFFVCPRIDENGKSDLKDVQNFYNEVKAKLPVQFRGAVLHSRLSNDQKKAVEDDFSNRKLDYIVATTMVEVGVDIKNATIMVIERADFFGLSTLHQLRGRVGRGEKQSFCFLCYTDSISPKSLDRLKVIEQNNDGFKIAEEDLKFRGPGDFFGKEEQSGFLKFHFASLVEDVDIIKFLISEK